MRADVSRGRRRATPSPTTTIERFGRVDLVCNNAGVVCELAPMWEQRPETWRWLIDVKLMGVVHGVRTFAPLLIAQGSGHFLNTASGGRADAAADTVAPYNATMHAVVGLTETLNLELRRNQRIWARPCCVRAWWTPHWGRTPRHWCRTGAASCAKRRR